MKVCKYIKLMIYINFLNLFFLFTWLGLWVQNIQNSSFSSLFENEKKKTRIIQKYYLYGNEQGKNKIISAHNMRKHKLVYYVSTRMYSTVRYRQLWKTWSWKTGHKIFNNLTNLHILVGKENLYFHTFFHMDQPDRKSVV